MSNRLKFFLSHLLLSFLIALFVIGLRFFYLVSSTASHCRRGDAYLFNALGHRRDFRATFRFIGL